MITDQGVLVCNGYIVIGDLSNHTGFSFFESYLKLPFGDGFNPTNMVMTWDGNFCVQEMVWTMGDWYRLVDEAWVPWVIGGFALGSYSISATVW